MDVTRIEFANQLPTILKHINDAHFLSFDLELSGIPDQKRNKGTGPKSLKERYQELKRAAEIYHVLQVGLTCVEEDRANARYLIRSYNFNISPLVDNQLDLERDFTYSSGAVDFLLRHGYQMESAFIAGIPYLTRAETKPALEMALARWDNQAIPDIRIKPDDFKALNFMMRVRKEVEVWQTTKAPHKDYYDIIGQTEQGFSAGASVVALNRFEKRLVHQVIRAEYPSLQTLSRNDGVQVKPIDKTERHRIQANLQRRLKSTISNQTGFRWVAEAMAGGDLSGLDLDALSHINGNTEFDSTGPKHNESFSDHMNALYTSLKERKKVLVGHNCLLDLVYFFKTFYGPLPDTIDQFRKQAQDIFPLIIDTKYLSTNPGSLDAIRFRNSQLFQIDQALEEAKSPVLTDAEDHASYQNSERYHEAGFDSYVTAKVFLKLAYKIASEHPQTCVRAQSPPLPIQNKNATRESGIKRSQEHLQSATKLSSKTTLHTNRFKSLADLQDEDHGHINREKHRETESPAPVAKAEPKDHTGDTGADCQGQLINPVKALYLGGDESNRNMPGLIPHWESPFWIEFGNKIRVYGTVEGICDLTDKPKVNDFIVNGNTAKDNQEESTMIPLLDGLKSVVGKIL